MKQQKNRKNRKPLREARMLKGLAQKELAAKVGIPASHLNKLERGKSFPQKATRQKIEKGLSGVHIDWLTTRLAGDTRLDVFPDGVVARETRVMAAISEFVGTGQMSERRDSFDFLRDFLDRYERRLKEGKKKKEGKKINFNTRRNKGEQ